MKNMRIRNIPDELHKKFKITCAMKGVSLNARVLELMEREVADTLGVAVEETVKGKKAKK